MFVGGVLDSPTHNALDTVRRTAVPGRVTSELRFSFFDIPHFGQNAGAQSHPYGAPWVSRAGSMTLLEHPFDQMPIRAQTRCAFLFPTLSGYHFYYRYLKIGY